MPASGELRMRSAKRLKMFEPAFRLAKLPPKLLSLTGVVDVWDCWEEVVPLLATELLLPPKARRNRLESLADGGGAVVGCSVAGRSQMQRNFSHSGHSRVLSH